MVLVEDDDFAFLDRVLFLSDSDAMHGLLLVGDLASTPLRYDLPHRDVKPGPARPYERHR
jgi:hypothetical protein